ncbi:GTP-binding protein [Aequorivita sp. SDUM287046]|uniref:GTP-binding protein n=1 Tax=Aequorivita aurantiaca TaxID=3053356 RepID=A0ABT8DKG1_9FLAO|nr:GTP-binding protein [Aequorivita aurantiaca]MDN3724390.1 GTP-binding protein [Aequorivita aurantiaca]
MLPNEIILRPRFKLEVEQPCSHLFAKFSEIKKSQRRFVVSCIDDHIFIKLPNGQQHFWSPQLHLELSDLARNKCLLQGFFGPNPTVWTMFMFLHVAVGILFMVNLTWLYSNFNLGNSFGLQIAITVILILLWILLYVAGRIGKKKGKPGMRDLYDFMDEIINSET